MSSKVSSDPALAGLAEKVSSISAIQNLLHFFQRVGEEVFGDT